MTARSTCAARPQQAARGFEAIRPGRDRHDARNGVATPFDVAKPCGMCKKSGHDA
ncbi:hypothetical protein [Limimaricola litoreus]|nr:hypothetical protein [Limimaricola litoreus]